VLKIKQISRSARNDTFFRLVNGSSFHNCQDDTGTNAKYLQSVEIQIVEL